MTPDWVEAGKALIGVFVTARDLTMYVAAPLLSVADTLLRLATGGAVQTLGRVNDATVRRMEARAAGAEADAALKNMEVLRKAVDLANEAAKLTADAPASARGGPTPNVPSAAAATAEAALTAALTRIAIKGGSLHVDEAELRALLSSPRTPHFEIVFGEVSRASAVIGVTPSQVTLEAPPAGSVADPSAAAAPSDPSQ